MASSPTRKPRTPPARGLASDRERPLSPDRHVGDDGRVHAVAVACQGVDGRWLLIRRARTVRAPLAVAFPGGALEAGEDQATAVVREMQEELGVAVSPITSFWRHDFPDHPLTLWGWHATLLEDTFVPAPEEVHEVLWLTAAEASAHPDRTDQMTDFIAALERHMGRLNPNARTV